MSNKEETSKAKKGKESSNKPSKNTAKNDNKQKKPEQNIKEKEENPGIKVTNELSQKEREYLGILDNLTLKLKIIEQNTGNEESKLTAKNTEKQKRLEMLTSSNQKIKQSLDLLTEKIGQIQANIEKEKKEKLEKLESQTRSKSKDKKNNKNQNTKENNLSKEDQDIKSKQKLINILSNENDGLKKSINRYFELSTNNKLYVELREKENKRKKLEKEIKNYEEIMTKHRTECAKTISKLEKELGALKNKLYLQNKEYHSKNKDYIYIQSKFSLEKKEDEVHYNEIKNKKNFLDMDKQLYLVSPEVKKVENIKINLNKKKEFARDVENGLINKYEVISLPKIDVNHEQKIISSIFTEEEMDKIKTLFLNQYQNDEQNFITFKEKVLELEKGGNTSANPEEELKEENSGLEKEIDEYEGNALLEKMKLKTKNLEVNKTKLDYRKVLTKNIKLKQEEKNLKEKLEKLKFKYNIMLKAKNVHHDVDDIIDGINNIVAGPNKNKKKKIEENKAMNDNNTKDVKENKNKEIKENSADDN